MRPYLIFDARFPEWRGTPINALLSDQSFIGGILRHAFENADRMPEPMTPVEIEAFRATVMKVFGDV